MGYFAKVYLTLSGMEDAEEFKEKTLGLRNAVVNKQGDFFTESLVYAHDYLVFYSREPEHLMAEEQLDSIFRIMPGYLRCLLPQQIKRQLHVTIFDQGSQGGGLHLTRELLRDIACFQTDLILTHHQIPNYGEEEPFVVVSQKLPSEDHVLYCSCYAHLQITSANLSPEQITSLIGLTPTETKLKMPSHKAPVPQLMNCWDLSSLAHVQSLNLTDHLSWLVDQLDTVQSNIQQLSFDMDLNLGGISLTGHFPPHHRMVWPADLLRRIAELNLWLDFDHYFQSELYVLDSLET